MIENAKYGVVVYEYRRTPNVNFFGRKMKQKNSVSIVVYRHETTKNPTLEIVNALENKKVDKPKKVHKYTKRKRTKLSKDKENEIRSRYLSGQSGYAIAADMGLGQSSVYKYINKNLRSDHEKSQSN